MSAVSEAGSQRMTLGALAQRYGFDPEPDTIANVTVTSLADDVESVKPGALFIARTPADIAALPRAAQAGAYAALLPHSARGRAGEYADLPLLFGSMDDHRLGELASVMAGAPSNALAVFAVAGDDDATVSRDVEALGDLLHMLGNPVAVISADGSRSMERPLDLTYPLGVLDVQRALAVCAEDGVAAAIVALDSRTIAESGLESVVMDVLGTEDSAGRRMTLDDLHQRYGFAVDADMRLTVPTSESRQLSLEASMATGQGVSEPLALSIAMVLAAGVRRSNVRSALRVSKELR